jgi:diguanylate cyclase (GGDEF)-like protein
VLEVFARTDAQTLRESDPFGRLGGEECAAVLNGAGRMRSRKLFATASTRLPGRWMGMGSVGATVSIGVSRCDGPSIDVSSLLAQADGALYLAKENGRN